jgi:hypothetical protein
MTEGKLDRQRSEVPHVDRAKCPVGGSYDIYIENLYVLLERTFLK